MRNFALTLCYDGTRYDGWQKQGNTDNTLQGRLETLLSRLLGQNIELAGSGRTDAGVHAYRQVCSFRADTDEECEALLREIRRRLPEDIGAISLEEADGRFHARLSCTGKTYVYRIWNSEEPNVFERKWTWRRPGTLDIEEMQKAADALTGEHDFTSFCGNRHMKKSAVRELRSISVMREGEEVRITLKGNGFLYHMARIIVGTLVEVGEGKWSSGEMEDILSSRDRTKAGPTAPAQGLILWSVEY